ncbi:MAG: hypothetical protein K0R27_1319 [Xanthobacteraceae bacterium]|jgi:hypothetical protein|nr:hypothetical protein [Xanthobacteraceae bacterium]
MNTANLQLEGLLLAISALCLTLKQKGILSDAEIGEALRAAETAAKLRGDTSELRNANIDAIHFPIRFLKRAVESGPEPLDFCRIASRVGSSKQNARLADPAE